MPGAKSDTLGEVKRRMPDLVYEPGFPDDTNVFVKTSDEDIFGPEVAGLESMRQTDAIRIANVIGVGKCKQHALVLEAIESSAPSEDFFDRFARQLAAMHRHGSADRFGFEHDNFLGATQQFNPWTESWCEFLSQSRIEFQLKLARDNGHGGSELQKLGERLLGRLDSLIGGSAEQPTLIHGDLWSGNWLCDRRGEPALIDPAVYYANRESEFGMTTLFGGLPPRFYAAYNEAWPMEDDWEDRVAIYRLYHLLNHLNLFGSSYLADCLTILRQFT